MRFTVAGPALRKALDTAIRCAHGARPGSARPSGVGFEPDTGLVAITTTDTSTRTRETIPCNGPAFVGVIPLGIARSIVDAIPVPDPHRGTCMSGLVTFVQDGDSVTVQLHGVGTATFTFASVGPGSPHIRDETSKAKAVIARAPVPVPVRIITSQLDRITHALHARNPDSATEIARGQGGHVVIRQGSFTALLTPDWKNS